MSETKKIKKTGKYNWFIVCYSDSKAHNFWSAYEGSNYKEALLKLGGIEVGTKETKCAFLQGVMLNKEEQELVGDKLDEAITNAYCDDRKSNYIIVKGKC